jgi:hypothetical protein
MSTPLDFRQVYCTQNAITEADYAEHLLHRVLPPHARIFRAISLFTLQNRNYFRADFDFINDIGCLRNYRDYNQSVDEFVVHPWNKRTLLRGLLRMRVSTSRVRQIVREQLKPKAKTEPQSSLDQSSAPAILSTATTVAAALPTKDVLTEVHKDQIKERLAQITPAPTLPPQQPVSQPELSPATSGQTYRLQYAQRNARSRTATLHQGQSRAETEAEIDVLRVINERLKSDLERMTAQRDILKQAAAILAAP